MEVAEEVHIQVNKSVFDDDKGVWLRKDVPRLCSGLEGEDCQYTTQLDATNCYFEGEGSRIVARRCGLCARLAGRMVYSKKVRERLEEGKCTANYSCHEPLFQSAQLCKTRIDRLHELRGKCYCWCRVVNFQWRINATAGLW